jgi:hypothetical protein
MFLLNECEWERDPGHDRNFSILGGGDIDKKIRQMVLQSIIRHTHVVVMIIKRMVIRKTTSVDDGVKSVGNVLCSVW